jgi:hypothetical protein
MKYMNNKILCIFVLALLVITIFPAEGIININEKEGPVLENNLYSTFEKQIERDYDNKPKRLDHFIELSSSGQDVKRIDGDLVIKKTDEIIDNFEISNYYIDGNVILEFSNCTFSKKGIPWLNITNLWTKGDIIVLWGGPGGVHISIFSNPIVYGNISVHIFDVYTHDGVILEIYDNGENAIDQNKNQAVGRIDVLLDHNWCMPMWVDVSKNWVHYSVNIIVSPRNAVNTFNLGVSENHIGKNLDIQFIDNDVDRVFTVNINDNIIGEYMHVDISGNPHFGWKQVQCQCIIHIDIKNNHCVERNQYNYIWINANVHYGIPFYNTISENGFGGDFGVFIMVNSNIGPGKGDMQNKFEKNKCDMQMDIEVLNNANFDVRDYAINNKAADKKPDIKLQVPIQNIGNEQEDQQTIGDDADNDGLTNSYEDMIGTNPFNMDTDNDGISDGWIDSDNNKVWDSDEKMGEIGDPGQHVDAARHLGSISTLFTNDEENPNPINKDIYVEIDFLTGCVFDDKVLSPVKEIFAKHCIWLHIDMGWAPGLIGGKTGGDVINAGINYKGKRYLYFDSIGTRRILVPFPIFKNDFYDLKIGGKFLFYTSDSYFDGGTNGQREDVFHYVVVTPYYAMKKLSGFGIQYDDGAYGVGEIGRFPNCGDDFLICYANHVNPDNTLNTSELRDTFMHELGHNLGLVHSWEGGAPPAGSDPDPLVNPVGPEMVFNTTMYWSGAAGITLDYLRMEWERLDLPKVADGVYDTYS